MTDQRSQQGTIAANGAIVALYTLDMNSALVRLSSPSGPWVGTIAFEGSIDGANWDSIAATPVAAAGADVRTATGNGLWSVDTASLAQLRLRASAWTSGSATVAIEATTSRRSPTAASGGGGPATIADGADVAQGATTDAAYADGTGAAAGTVVGLLKGIFRKVAGAISVVRNKATPTESAVSGAGSGSLVVAGARQSVRATLVSGSAWVSRATPAATAAPARLMGAGDYLYDDETTAAWYYTAVGGTATFSVEVVA